MSGAPDATAVRGALEQYYADVEAGYYQAAVRIFTQDVLWTHVWSWTRRSDSNRLPNVDTCVGRDAVREWLERVGPKANASGILHTVRDLILDGDHGVVVVDTASTAHARRGQFLVWIRLTEDGALHQYDMRPV
ncbi:SnoaL-like domain-containing protein [Rhodococcus sp. 14C212]|uniref:nuclear transport factor 2 family protein n=1 Tax=Rhodococcus sp. 14C212 TaxID=2711209 RepID=UPI0013EB7706|nr:nuclear transport factor 2 family protein [Rhodococcus sp. 14C212]NGP08662.1 SnoaL-like domain-containing protein [Rhodococcus sp. 14C212]